VSEREPAYFRFYAGLNDFLSPEQRGRAFPQPPYERQSVKHLIESLGAPHTEVELILANGRAVDFDYLVQPGDRIAVYPHFHRLDLGVLARLRPPPPAPPRFLLDIHLGRLAAYLRLLGFDTRYPDGNHDDADLAQIAHDENRILLTRDRGLLKRSLVRHGYCLRTRDSRDQLQAVLRRFDLFDRIRPWRRCLRCNGRLQPIAKEKIMHRLEPKTKKYFHEFHICQQCDQIYWKGSHYQRLEKLIATMRGAA
jgi:hypothetical protein